MRRARHRVLYDGYKNSLVEWTLTDEWTQPSWVQNETRGQVVTRKGDLITFGNDFQGEIDAT